MTNGVVWKVFDFLWMSRYFDYTQRQQREMKVHASLTHLTTNTRKKNASFNIITIFTFFPFNFQPQSSSIIPSYFTVLPSFFIYYFPHYFTSHSHPTPSFFFPFFFLCRSNYFHLSGLFKHTLFCLCIYHCFFHSWIQILFLIGISNFCFNYDGPDAG